MQPRVCRVSEHTEGLNITRRSSNSSNVCNLTMLWQFDCLRCRKERRERTSSNLSTNVCNYIIMLWRYEVSHEEKAQ